MLASIDTRAWTVPPVFQALLAWSGMDHAEAYRVFNMGMGMVAVIPAAHLAAAQVAVPEAAPMGTLTMRPPDAARVDLV